MIFQRYSSYYIYIALINKSNKRQTELKENEEHNNLRQHNEHIEKNAEKEREADGQKRQRGIERAKRFSRGLAWEVEGERGRDVGTRGKGARDSRRGV